jgi:hypothetical protein
VLILAVASSGCSKAEETELRVLRAVVEAVDARIPGETSTCVSTRYLTKGFGSIPGVLKESLIRDGWDLYDPMAGADSIGRPPNFPPDTGSALIFVDPVEREGQDWLVYASYTETYLHSDRISWAVFDLRYRISCVAGVCEPVEVTTHGHGDGGGITAADFFRRGRPRCGRREQRSGAGRDG